MFNLLNGAFIAYQEKNKWLYKANIDKIGLKKSKPISLKEKPEYPQIEDIEKEAKGRYGEQNNKMTIDVIKFLNSI